MYTHAVKTQKNKSQSTANADSQKMREGNPTRPFVVNRLNAIPPNKIQETTKNSTLWMYSRAFQAIPNHDRQPAQLHPGTESSDKPIQLARRKKGKGSKNSDYNDRLRQRVLDRTIGREARELAELSGQDPSTLLPPPAAPPVPVIPPAPPATGILRRQAKHQALGLPRMTRSNKKRFKRAAKRDESSYRVSGTGLVISTEGQASPYDEHFPKGQIFWRADTRPPKEVLRTGFSPKVERDIGLPTDAPGRKRPNQIIFRTGDDDIVPATGVCVARDPRGACFFPFDASEKDPERDTEHGYVYGIALHNTVSTVKAQRRAESAETGYPERDWRRPQRFGYDPQEIRADQGSAVWPFHEHVVHRIEPHQIVAAHRFERQRLIDNDVGDDVKAGMRFRLQGKQLIRRKPKNVDEQRWRTQAREATQPYTKDFYPRHPQHYLSYQGLVTPKGKRPTSTTSADAGVHQINPFAPRPQELIRASRRKGSPKQKQRGNRKGLGHRSKQGIVRSHRRQER